MSHDLTAFKVWTGHMKLNKQRSLVVTLWAMIAVSSRAGDDRAVSSGQHRKMVEGVGQLTLSVQAEPPADAQAEGQQHPKGLPQHQSEKPKVWLTTSEVQGQQFVTAHWQGLGEPALLVFNKIPPQKEKYANSPEPPRPSNAPARQFFDLPICLFRVMGSGDKTVKLLTGPFVDGEGSSVSHIGLVATKEISLVVQVRTKRVEGQPLNPYPKTIEKKTFTVENIGTDPVTIAAAPGAGAVRFLDVLESREFQVPESGQIGIYTNEDDMLAESQPIAPPKP